MAPQRTPIVPAHAISILPRMSREFRQIGEQTALLVVALAGARRRLQRAALHHLRRLDLRHLARQFASQTRLALSKTFAQFSVFRSAALSAPAMRTARPNSMGRFGSSPPPRFPLAPIPGGLYQKRLFETQSLLTLDCDRAADRADDRADRTDDRACDRADDEPTMIHTFIAPDARVIREGAPSPRP